MNEFEEKAREAGQNAANDLTKALNSMSYEKEVTEGFVTALTNTHRSLQQSTMRSIFSLLMRWAEDEEVGKFDARNEATVKFCSKIKKLAEGENVHFPFI